MARPDLVHRKQSLRLWLRLLTTTTIVEKHLRSQLKSTCDSTLPRFDVLSALDRAGEPLTMGSLTGRLLVSNGNTTLLVNRLVEEGLIARFPDANDRRTIWVSLTRAGKATFKKVAKSHESMLDDIFDLPDAEMAKLLRLMTELNHLVEAKLKEPDA